MNTFDDFNKLRKSIQSNLKRLDELLDEEVKLQKTLDTVLVTLKNDLKTENEKSST